MLTRISCLLTLAAGLLLPLAGAAAPIIGDPDAAAGPPSSAAGAPSAPTETPRPGAGDTTGGGGPPTVGVTISCAVEPDGTTTCAVLRGRAAVCPERIPGDDILRSYRRYDYLLVAGGCTLPVNYWQTHSRDGEAPFDDTWDRLGEDGETQFFNAPETYEEILVDGAGDGPYYRLARAYIAAELNSINGAPLPDEAARAFEEAGVLFLAADPAQVDADAGSRFAALATVLEDYNAGVTGPGTCPPLSEPFSAADVGKTLEGVETRDAGTVVSVDQRYGRGAGVVAIRPQSEADQFVLPDEAFTIDEIRKGKLTTELADCVDVAAGQQTTVAEGGLPSPPQLISAAFLDQERLMRLMVAVAEAATQGELAPAAGPAPSGPLAPAFPGTGFPIGGGASPFPSPTFPSIGGGGGASDAFIEIPDVIGQTVADARGTINGAGLSVGNVTITQQRAMLDGIIGVAWAQEDLIVTDQDPPGGTLVPADNPPAVDLTAESPAAAIPEPASLLLFATGLALIAIVMARRRAR